MPDRDKVLFALDCYAENEETCGDECPYFTRVSGYGYCAEANIARDAIALIEQKPIEPHAERDCDDGVWYYGCGACHGAIDYKDKFCRHCGREVKWDA